MTSRSASERGVGFPVTSEPKSRIRSIAGIFCFARRAARNLLTWRFGEDERERRQRVGAVLEALGLSAGSKVADVGAGAGFFTVRLARAVGPAGRVYAVEIEEELAEDLRRRAKEASFENVEAVLGAVDDPRLPEAQLDAALIVNSYHEMTAHESMLARIRAALREGGRLVVIEPYRREGRGDPRDEQVGRHEIAPQLVEEELRNGGLEIRERVDEFISYAESGRFDAMVVASRPAKR